MKKETYTCDRCGATIGPGCRMSEECGVFEPQDLKNGLVTRLPIGPSALGKSWQEVDLCGPCAKEVLDCVLSKKPPAGLRDIPSGLPTHSGREQERSRTMNHAEDLICQCEHAQSFHQGLRVAGECQANAQARGGSMMEDCGCKAFVLHEHRAICSFCEIDMCEIDMQPIETSPGVHDCLRRGDKESGSAIRKDSEGNWRYSIYEDVELLCSFCMFCGVKLGDPVPVKKEGTGR